jgi:hypothetical protein
MLLLFKPQAVGGNLGLSRSAAKRQRNTNQFSLTGGHPATAQAPWQHDFWYKTIYE